MDIVNLRVANIIEEGKLGGPQVRMCAVAAALKGQVETVVIMPCENSEAFQQRCNECEVPYITLSLTRITKEWQVAVRYVLFSFIEIFRLSRVLKRGRFDLAHVSGGAWQYKGVIAAKLAGVKVVWHLNDTSLPRFFRLIFAVTSPLAQGYIFSANRAKKYYKGLVSSKRSSQIIPPPVDTSYFSPERNYSGDETNIEKWEGKYVIGTVANINPIKGLDVFIKAAAALNNKFDGLVFVIIGSVSNRQKRYFTELQNLAKSLYLEDLYFIGARSDIRPLLSRFDAYVCSSSSETGPMTLWEAMSMERPVVSTDVGDVSMYVKNGDSGFIVDVGDSAAIADRLALLLENKKLRQDFGEKAREMAVRELDISRCAERHLAAYQEILSL